MRYRTFYSFGTRNRQWSTPKFPSRSLFLLKRLTAFTKRKTRSQPITKEQSAGFQNWKIAAPIKRETSVPPEWVCDTTYWAVSGSEVVGRIAIRHELNDFLKKAGGHIGYIVRPSWRKRGVATEMFRQTLLTDRARSIGKLLVTCDEGNVASEKTIVTNGDVLENVIDVSPDRPRKKRFWINLNA